MAISRFEALAQRLVEDSFRRLWGKGLQPLDVAQKLADEMAAAVAAGAAVSRYAIHPHPADHQNLPTRRPQLAQEIERFGQRLARQAQTPLPTIKFQPDPAVSPQFIQVIAASPAKDEYTPTQIQEPLKAAADDVLRPLLARQAFLVVNGREHHPLTKPMLTIGRRQESDIVLASPSVSRQHAQIRWRHGRFVLFNVSSRGKTAVNGIPKQEHILHSGDLIQLSQESLIYAEEGDGDEFDSGQPTQPFTPIRNRQPSP